MADIGQKLREAREAKGLSLEDVEKATKIQSRYLTAIENNDFDRLPGDFYARAFIRQYAQIVGLDGKELLADYHQEVPETDPEEYVENSIDNKSEEVRETTNNKSGLWKNYLPRIGIGVGIIVVILVIYVAYANFSGRGGSSSNSGDNSVTVSSTSSSSSSKKKKTTKKAVQIKDLGDNQYRVLNLSSNRKLVVRASSDYATTVTIAVDGSTEYSQTLSAGEKHTMNIPKGTEDVQITLSYDTGTKVTVAGKSVPYTASGSSLTLTLLIGKNAKASSSSSSSSSTTYSTTSSSSTYSSSSYSSSVSSSSSASSTSSSSQTQSSSSSSNTNANNNGNNDNNGGTNNNGGR